MPFAHMTGVRLGVGCERQSKVLFGLAPKPLLLLRHRGGVRPEKGNSVASIVQYEIIHLSRLRLVDDLPRFVKMLQGKSEVGEIDVRSCSLRRKAHGLPRDLHSFLILTLLSAENAQTVVRTGIPRVALNHLFICLGRLIQFSGYILEVVGSDAQLFPLAGVFPQLKCFGVVLAVSPRLK